MKDSQARCGLMSEFLFLIFQIPHPTILSNHFLGISTRVLGIVNNDETGAVSSERTRMSLLSLGESDF